MLTSANVTLVSEVGSACDEHRYSCHGSHGGTDGFAYAEAGRTVSADKMLGRKAAYPDGKMERRQYQMEKRVNSLMEEQETLQQEMRIKHKQDSEADRLAQPQTFSGYSGPVAAAIQKPMPFDGSIP